MSQDQLFFSKVESYAPLSEQSKKSWRALLNKEFFKKGDFFVHAGDIPTKAAFVVKGLFSQNYIDPSGDSTIKYFFPEGRIAASVSAILTKSPSLFSFEALEDSEVLTYNFHAFRNLVDQHQDIAAFYIRYMEKHWVVEKEPLEISFRYDTALQRYDQFLKDHPQLVKRLKKNHIASYLGITPTQFSRLMLSAK